MCFSRKFFTETTRKFVFYLLSNRIFRTFFVNGNNAYLCQRVIKRRAEVNFGFFYDVTSIVKDENQNVFEYYFTFNVL